MPLAFQVIYICCDIGFGGGSESWNNLRKSLRVIDYVTFGDMWLFR